ncbi:MAG TPA: DEAD/DEAH box helicase family protein [Bdellovibrionota bacterium]|nr:DEAD/DEAH box helicase family protein [Bdellovibrionota bacterium]
MRLRFDQGSLVVDPEGVEKLPSCVRWDPRVGLWRALAMHFFDLRAFCRAGGVPFAAEFLPFATLQKKIGSSRVSPLLRAFQEEALAAWRVEKGRGVVILPTGAGKTRLAVEAIGRTSRSALVVVPTLELLAQWYSVLSESFGGEVGRLGGGEHEIRPLTVTTYDSAYRWIDRYGDRFALLVFDEVHHLPAPSYVQIAQMSVAPFRLGLTATFERGDFRHVPLSEWVGPVVYRRSIDELSGEALASYRTEIRKVEMTVVEKEEFETQDRIYRTYLRQAGIRGRKAFDSLLDLAARDGRAWRALAAHRRARRVVAGASAKVELVGELLGQYADSKILIFTEYNDLVYRLSKEYLIPAITHLTSPKERRWILSSFREGKIRAIVTSKVLNEGVDVPEADVAIVLGGSGSRREHVQRLGRILRPLPGKEALLIEVITKAERGLSYRRRNDSAFRRKRPAAQQELLFNAHQ